jgi:16S rRNA (adenine1518-N6/adenine1519-N6)-dimethyltransferase
LESGKKLIEKYRLCADRGRSKRLGQHFLFDRGILEKIARCALPLADNGVVIEIGPGPCGLTGAILDICNPDRIYCIEKDCSLESMHADFAREYQKNIEFIYNDALTIRPQSLTDSNFTIISNLPYNVGTKLLTNWLLDLQGVDQMILMFQKEVADRICSEVGTKSYGRLSIISQLLCRVEKLFDVSNRAFYPSPKVTSTVVKLVPRKEIIVKNIAGLQNLTDLCFKQRRKMMHGILKMRYREEEVKASLLACEIDESARPETLSPAKFVELADNLSATKTIE